MKAPASISVISSFVLAVFASIGTSWSATNDVPGSSVRPVGVPVAKKTEPAPSPPSLSRGSEQIVQLTQAGMDESVVLSFIRGSTQFHLSADHIVYLSDLGVSSGIIQAMLAHDREVLVEKLSQTTNVATVSMSAQPETAAAVQVVEAAAFNPAATNFTPLVQVPMPLPMQPDSRSAKEDLIATQKPGRVQAATKRKVLYPVREPYPVELTAPIVFLDAPAF